MNVTFGGSPHNDTLWRHSNQNRPQDGINWTIYGPIIGISIFIVLLVIFLVIFLLFIKNKRKNEGNYNPRQTEILNKNKLPSPINMPNPERLI
uniref:Uncharacterized protein n=1 Tax=Lepeophtheirus salmonis TaxID=72036 RepID=A0A0K2V597_LEPSM